MDDRKVIYGIGNPDEKYAGTRHNVGWMVVDRLSQKLGRKFRKAGFEFEAAEGRLGRAEAVLVRSWTYVNLSGRVIPELKRYGDPATGLLVVCDEIQLPLGAVRLRKQGSAGGHNGLKSIIEAMGDGFARMRLGVGGAGAAARADYVLGRFSREEGPAVEEMVEYACAAAECWAVEGIEKAMAKYNRAGPDAKDEGKGTKD